MTLLNVPLHRFNLDRPSASLPLGEIKSFVPKLTIDTPFLGLGHAASAVLAFFSKRS